MVDMDHAMQAAAMKAAVGTAAAELVEPGMKVGIGTGSTTAYFINALIKRVSQGLICSVMGSSIASERAAAAGHLNMLDAEHTDALDLYVDGADYVDRDYRLIKGGGGALLREKITAAMSAKFICIVDSSKMVESLVNAKLPLEILRYGAAATIDELERLGARPTLRHTDHATPYLTDNGNWIADCVIPEAHKDSPEKFVCELTEVPGVLADGLFVNMATQIWVGTASGKIERYDVG